MNDRNFLTLVKRKGRYGSSGEASRAANAVFGTIKARLTPRASDLMRRALPQDASLLWQYSPVAGMAVPAHGRGGVTDGPEGPLHFVLRVQQLGRYKSSREARRATCSVMNAIAGSVSMEPVSFLGQVFPPDILGVCGARTDWNIGGCGV